MVESVRLVIYIKGVPVELFPPVPVFIVHKYRYFDQGPYLRPVLVYKSDVPRHLYYSGSNISAQRRRLCLGLSSWGLIRARQSRNHRDDSRHCRRDFWSHVSARRRGSQ